MSAEGEQQRRPGAPDDTDGKRRLRTVSYPDPFLVTKLPLEGTVNSGVIRLGEKMLLGFIHRPFPDGTRVRVVYDEWLFAERVDDEPESEPGADEAAEEKSSAMGKKIGGSKGRPGPGAPVDESAGKRFPEEFSDPESRANGELDSPGDAWTDTFGRSKQEE